MTQKQVKSTLPLEIVEQISQLGSRIRIARKRRKISSEEMAAKMFVSRKTLFRLENGDPGVSLGIFASALWALGLDRELLSIADPEQDKIGIFHERRNLPERIRKKREKNKLDF